MVISVSENILPLLVVMSIITGCLLASALVGWRNKQRVAKELAALRSAWAKPFRREILFLSEVRAYYSVIKEIRKCRQSLQCIFETLGELDSLQAVASFREGLQSYVKPDFRMDRTVLEIKDAVRPLIGSPVPNSVSLMDKGILITGSNMSGKSTFLRTLGINVVLAQSVLTCPATAYHGSLFHVITSLSHTDTLV